MDEYLLPPLSSFRVNEAYRPQKHKRGGIAGLWDRNKGVLTTAAELAAGAIGGPAAASATGALIKGLDRPGQRGIGFDVGQAARGGLEGYTMGKVGQYGAGKLKGMFTPGVPPVAAAAQPTGAELISQGVPLDESGALIGGDSASYIASPTPPEALGLRPMPAQRGMTDTLNIGRNAMRAPISSVPASAQAALPPSTYMPQDFSLSNLLKATGRGVAGAFEEGGLVQRNPEVFAGIAQGLIGGYGAAQDRELQRQEMLRQREQQARLAALLMPMYEQYYGIGG